MITPRVYTRHGRRSRPGRRPPSYEEAVSDEDDLSEQSSGEESGAESSEGSVGKRSITSSERSDVTRSSQSRSETESEGESSEEGSRRGARGGGRKSRRRTDYTHSKHRAKKPMSRDSRERDSDTSSRRRARHSPPPAPPGPPVPYPAYPPGGQFVPVMAGPQFQPVPLVPAYAPPRYPAETRPPHPSQPAMSSVQPTDPPVYSYLVRRGYNPVDTQSQASVSGSQRSGGHRDEPDVRLEHGVEYMRR